MVTDDGDAFSSSRCSANDYVRLATFLLDFLQTPQACGFTTPFLKVGRCFWALALMGYLASYQGKCVIRRI
jgi:hypothetical protein